ncbi:hypothetical protein M0805_009370 [Coniferiporia weirii]|nr:hypothetical protein M0805_009370 [Coniferiporia weirii]
MASLLDRIDVSPLEKTSGPIRSRGGRRVVSGPYDRTAALGQSKADEATVWKHDMYNGPGKSLNSRLSNASENPPRVNANGAVLALRRAIGLAPGRSSTADLSIRGASAAGSNVVQIENLASGTTAADVEAIFKRCGPIIESYNHGPENASKVTVRLKFKSSDDAKRAVNEYNGKSADGNTLVVSIIGSASTSLGGRLEGGLSGTVDVLLADAESEPIGGSKMRSDGLLSDPRAQVLTIPPGVDPVEYEQRRGGRGRGQWSRGRGGRKMRGRRTGNGMVVD